MKRESTDCRVACRSVGLGQQMIYCSSLFKQLFTLIILMKHLISLHVLRVWWSVECVVLSWIRVDENFTVLSLQICFCSILFLHLRLTLSHSLSFYSFLPPRVFIYFLILRYLTMFVNNHASFKSIYTHIMALYTALSYA